MIEALEWLGEQGSASIADFRRHFRQRADQLREGIAAHGYTQQRDGQIALSVAGLRRVAVISKLDGTGNG